MLCSFWSHENESIDSWQVLWSLVLRNFPLSEAWEGREQAQMLESRQYKVGVSLFSS